MVSRIDAVASSLVRSQRATLPAPTSVTVGSGVTSACSVRGGDTGSAVRGSVASRQVANKAPTARMARTARGAGRSRLMDGRLGGREVPYGLKLPRRSRTLRARNGDDNSPCVRLLRSVAVGPEGRLWHPAYSYAVAMLRLGGRGSEAG